MFRSIRAAAIGLLSAGLVSGCLGDSSPTDSGGGNPMSATVNGAPWAADVIATRAEYYASTDALALIGVSLSSYTLRITLVDATAPGVYPFRTSEPLRFASMATLSGGAWESTLEGGSGSVTITSITQNRIRGTFQLVAPAAEFSSEEGTLTVTAGQFDLGLERYD